MLEICSEWYKGAKKKFRWLSVLVRKYLFVFTKLMFIFATSVMLQACGFITLQFIGPDILVMVLILNKLKCLNLHFFVDIPCKYDYNYVLYGLIDYGRYDNADPLT